MSPKTANPLFQLGRLYHKLTSVFIERDTEIASLLISLLAEEHVLLLGPPGTAKSALARAVCESIEGASYFQWLLTKFSTPEEIFGPISLKGLEADEYRRITAHKAPEAHVIFIDEIFKANSAILNSLLTLLNEREFHNNGAPVKCPLKMAIGASNELPDGYDLGALFDRFLLRHWVDYIKDTDSFKAMLTQPEPKISAKIATNAVGRLKAYVQAVSVQPVIDQLIAIKHELSMIGITASDRRWKRCIGLVRAAAVLRTGIDAFSGSVSNPDATDEDLLVLEHAMWLEPSQRAAVREKIGSIAAPLTAEAVAIMDAATEAYRGILELSGRPDFLVKSIEVRATLKEMRTRLESTIAHSGKKSNRAEKILQQLKRMQDDLKRRSDRALD